MFPDKNMHYNQQYSIYDSEKQKEKSSLENIPIREEPEQSPMQLIKLHPLENSQIKENAKAKEGPKVVVEKKAPTPVIPKNEEKQLQKINNNIQKKDAAVNTPKKEELVINHLEGVTCEPRVEVETKIEPIVQTSIQPKYIPQEEPKIEPITQPEQMLSFPIEKTKKSQIDDEWRMMVKHEAEAAEIEKQKEAWAKKMKMKSYKEELDKSMQLKNTQKLNVQKLKEKEMEMMNTIKAEHELQEKARKENDRISKEYYKEQYDIQIQDHKSIGNDLNKNKLAQTMDENNISYIVKDTNKMIFKEVFCHNWIIIIRRLIKLLRSKRLFMQII